jgi:hypothetical protein
MRTSCLVLAFLLLTGCATALKRDGQCLASLTPDFLTAHEELDRLEASWRASMLRRDTELNASSPRRFLRPTERTPAGATALAAVSVYDSPEASPVSLDGLGQRESGAPEAYRRLIEAKARHQPTLSWYDRVYQRLRTRLDEERILSNVRMVLLTGPGLLFYPVIHWNVHSVFWDGADPDAESDPVTRYCTDRLSQMVASTEFSGDVR